MKCNCGYEYEEGIDSNGEWKILKGDKEFINSELVLTWEINSFSSSKRTVNICPKCGVLKVDLY
jgi:rubredoxin